MFRSILQSHFTLHWNFKFILRHLILGIIFLVCIWRQHMWRSIWRHIWHRAPSWLTIRSLFQLLQQINPAISWWISKLTTILNVLLTSLSVSNACVVVHVFWNATKMAANCKPRILINTSQMFFRDKTMRSCSILQEIAASECVSDVNLLIPFVVLCQR